MKTVFGLHNDTQDMEFLHTTALLPQSVYPTDLRDADRPVFPPKCRTRLMRSANRAWRTNQDWSEDTIAPIEPQPEKRYTKPIVVLTSAASCSATEDSLATLDGAKQVTIIGEPTCGGSLRTCTRNCRYADGWEFNGVGIQPHVRVTPTVADVRAGKDPALEAAIAKLKARP